MREWIEDETAARIKYGDISEWDVSGVTDMSHLFFGAKQFNADLSKWDVGQVVSMRYMFYEAFDFNGNLSKWKVGNVRDMRGMFFQCKQFKADLSKWQVDNVREMGFMFAFTTNFNADLNNWQVGSVRGTASMFNNALAFDQSLTKWNLSNVRNVWSMFSETRMMTNCNKRRLYDAWMASWYARPRTDLPEKIDNVFVPLAWPSYKSWGALCDEVMCGRVEVEEKKETSGMVRIKVTLNETSNDPKAAAEVTVKLAAKQVHMTRLNGNTLQGSHLMSPGEWQMEYRLQENQKVVSKINPGVPQKWQVVCADGYTNINGACIEDSSRDRVCRNADIRVDESVVDRSWLSDERTATSNLTGSKLRFQVKVQVDETLSGKYSLRTVPLIGNEQIKMHATGDGKDTAQCDSILDQPV